WLTRAGRYQQQVVILLPLDGMHLDIARYIFSFHQGKYPIPAYLDHFTHGFQIQGDSLADLISVQHFLVRREQGAVADNLGLIVVLGSRWRILRDDAWQLVELAVVEPDPLVAH